MASQKEALAALAKVNTTLPQISASLGTVKSSLEKALGEQAANQQVFDGMVATSTQVDAIGAQVATITADVAALSPIAVPAPGELPPPTVA